VEITGMEDSLRLLFEQAALERNLHKWIRLHWLDARATKVVGDWGHGKDAAKRARGAGILPFYQRGEVWHHEGLRNSALENQEMSYPKCPRWDALDCAGYIPHLLRQGGLWWEARAEAVIDDMLPEPRRRARVTRDEITRRIRSGKWRRMYSPI